MASCHFRATTEPDLCGGPPPHRDAGVKPTRGEALGLGKVTPLSEKNRKELRENAPTCVISQNINEQRESAGAALKVLLLLPHPGQRPAEQVEERAAEVKMAL